MGWSKTKPKRKKKRATPVRQKISNDLLRQIVREEIEAYFKQEQQRLNGIVTVEKVVGDFNDRNMEQLELDKVTGLYKRKDKSELFIDSFPKPTYEELEKSVDSWKSKFLHAKSQLRDLQIRITNSRP